MWWECKVCGGSVEVCDESVKVWRCVVKVRMYESV